MDKKYMLTDETKKTEYGITLHRIKALKSFDDVKAGDLGDGLKAKTIYLIGVKRGFMTTLWFITALKLAATHGFVIVLQYAVMQWFKSKPGFSALLLSLELPLLTDMLLFTVKQGFLEMLLSEGSR